MASPEAVQTKNLEPLVVAFDVLKNSLGNFADALERAATDEFVS